MNRPFGAIALWLGLCVQAALAGEVMLTKERSPDPKRGEGIVRQTIEAQFANAALRYVAIAPADSERALVEKYGDYFLGLDFGRPPRTNGGWNLWNFLTVQVTHAGESFSAMQRYLGDAFVLEQGPRTVLAFEWLLAEPADSAATPPRLRVLLLHDPATPEWLFMRVQTTDPATTLQRVQLSCFPANTSGPPERERWIATEAGEIKASNAATPLPLTAGIAFFNQYAQKDAGCLLVYSPQDVQSVEARGTYAVNTAFAPRAGVQELSFALGYFMDADRERTVRRFFGEGAPQIEQALASIDWQPQVEYAQHDTMLRELAQIVQAEATPEQAEAFTALMAAYREAKRDGADFQAMTAVQQLRAFKEDLLVQALAQYR